MERECQVSWLSLIDYQQAWDKQAHLAHERAQHRIPDQLLLLEHPHVFTFGRRGRTENVLSSDAEIDDAGARIIHSDRGGDVTYHGPGQLVGYPILFLEESERDIPGYVRKLEEAVIRTLADYSITAGREAHFPGVWVGNEKICAVGVKISEWVTLHGFALNVSTDLAFFRHIVPCGIVGKGVTSMERLLAGGPGVGGQEPDERVPAVQEVGELFVIRFAEVFGRRMTTSCDGATPILSS